MTTRSKKSNVVEKCGMIKKNILREELRGEFIQIADHEIFNI